MSKLKSFGKIPIVVLIGGGSKLPAILKAAKNPNSKFYISLVVSHKADSQGIKLAVENKIPGVYFKLPDYRKRIFNNSDLARPDYMKRLGWFITQREYKPRLLVFAGWDLVMDSNFFDFFKAGIGNGYAAINLHPAIMPLKNEGNRIKLPDGSTTPVIRGEQQEVLETVFKNKLTYFGPSIHFMVPTEFDTGTVIKREFIKVNKNDTIKSLRKKLMPVEDKILVDSVNEIVARF